MRFFGYYALHSFVNQLRKLFKTWVLVFFVVCFAIGGLIGVFAATLEDTIESQQEPTAIVEIAEPEPEEESPGLPIDTAALIELIAGAAVLVLFFFEAVSADKNGSKIFLPADVNLLFPSPMKPQSVLMFRLATQLGTALIATIYIVFQLPNLMLNAGLSGWAAVAILVTWFSAILIGKLLQVMLYTVCSTNLQFKKYLRKGVYAFGLILAASFLVYFKTSGLEILPAADRFFNGSFTRWIPFWGWLKGLTIFVAEQNWSSAGVCLVLLAAGCAGLVYLIWHLNADFYEDAMAKSEETAALMEKARSEKTSGTAATRQRKKDRKESLRRDGMKHGQGANVFFFKPMYNRFRFAHFGFLTKTMETYFVAAIGTAAAMRFYFGSDSILPVVLTLGGLVFFRAMGNPLAEDTGMDFFRLIPESTWQKLFYSLLGGTANCLLDLLPPMLAASAVMMVNPLKLLIWLPLIVSVDFYASSVVTFIDLSVPASIGKTIKQLITVMFIYFGLLPDIAVLAFGIVLGHTAAAAIGSTAVNLLLGMAAFSLASVFLQPKGKDYVKAQAEQDYRSARRAFSRVGFGILLMPIVTTVLQLLFSYVAINHFPSLLNNSWVFWLMIIIPQYLAAVPLALLIMRKVPAIPPERHTLGFIRGVKFFFICIAGMAGGLILSAITTVLFGSIIGTQSTNPLEILTSGDNLFAQTLFMAVLAPIFEEFLFRKQLIDRLRTYGGKTAVLISAMIFGLVHGNFFQFFYTFALGVIFGYIYLNTGKLRYTIIAHITINTIGSILVPEALARIPMELSPEEILAQNNPWIWVYLGYLLLLLIGGIIGAVLFFMNIRSYRFPAGTLELPKGKRLRISILNLGMLLMLLVLLGEMAVSLFS